MKRTRSRLTFFAAVAALALMPCSVLLAQDYEIRLHRPDAVGARYHLSITAKQASSQVAKQGDKIVQDQKTKFTVEAELVVTVLAASEKGKSTKLKLDVEKLIRIEGDARRELTPKGSVITARLDGDDEVFEMAGSTLEPDTVDSLKLLSLLPDDANGPTDDEVFGAKDRKKVGDHWEGNTDLMAKEMVRRGLTVKKEDLKSTITLDKVFTVGRKEWMQLSCVVACDKLAPSLPPGVTVDKSAMKMSYTLVLPVAASDPAAEGSTDMTMSFVARGKPDPIADEIVVQMSSERSLVGRATEVK